MEFVYHYSIVHKMRADDKHKAKEELDLSRQQIIRC